MTSLYGSQPSFVPFACKTATLVPELQVSMGPRPHLDNSDIMTRISSLSCLVPQLQVSMSPRPRLWFLAFKTATLAPELQVSMGNSPHRWFLHAKQRLLDQNFKSPWVPYFAC